MSEDNHGTFSIRVVDERGYPVRSAKVQCAYGLFHGVHTAYTDDNGWAEFPIITEMISGGAMSITAIWVNGEEVRGDSFT
jgi:hypothetical protein